MASFNLGPHPHMMEILNANPDLKMAVPLTNFLDALDKRENGYTWNDLRPEGVSAIAWYELYDAYLKDERENDDYRTRQTAEIASSPQGRISDNTGKF